MGCAHNINVRHTQILIGMKYLHLLSFLVTVESRHIRSSQCRMHTALGMYAHMAKFHELPNDIHNGGENGRTFFQRNWEPSIRCIADRRMGVPGDGGKWVCDPNCLLVHNNCNILSVGSANDFTFEDSFKSYGCAVHTFDHTVREPKPPIGVTFHPYGAASQSHGEFRSLSEMAAVSNMNETIDILKIDCEGCEFDIFLDEKTQHFLKLHVKQVLVEVHFSTRLQTEALAQAFLDSGFRVFSKEPNIQYSDGNCVEYGLLNIHL